MINSLQYSTRQLRQIALQDSLCSVCNNISRFSPLPLLSGKPSANPNRSFSAIDESDQATNYICGRNVPAARSLPSHGCLEMVGLSPKTLLNGCSINRSYDDQIQGLRCSHDQTGTPTRRDSGQDPDPKAKPSLAAKPPAAARELDRSSVGREISASGQNGRGPSGDDFASAR